MSFLNSELRLTWRWPLAAASVLSLMLLLAIACGEGESRGTAPPDAGSPPASDIPSEEARQELVALSAAWASNSAKITYDFTRSAGSAITDAGFMTLYRRPPDWRMDIRTSDQCACDSPGEQTMILPGNDTFLIAAGDDAYLCAVEDGKGECLPMDSPESEAVHLPFLEALITPDALSESVAEAIAGADIGRTQEQIAGKEANCYTVGGSATEESDGTQWCFDKDGILLRLSGAYSDTPGAGPFRLEATSVSREVSDADFQLPYPLT